MPRYADIQNGYTGVNWQGIDPDVVAFRDELAKRFPQLKITSAVRTGSGVGKSGKGSRHNKGQALDLGADPEIQKFLYSAEGDAMLRRHNLGFLDETLKHNMEKTGATGPHLHIGKDSTLSGNRYHGNTAFERGVGDDHDHGSEEVTTEGTQDIQDPNNLNTFYDQNQGGNSTAFLEKIYQEKSTREAELAAEVEAEKAAITRQNAIQERLKEKMENQVRMMEMIKGHELEMVKRDRPKFEEGGEFAGINENLDFKIQQIKDQMPKITMKTLEESPIYLELQQVRGEIEDILSAFKGATSQPQVSAPTVVADAANDAVSDAANDAVSEGVNLNLKGNNTSEKIHNKLKELGLQKHQIAGVLGSLTGESGENLSAVAKNPTSGAFGIAQWLGSRLTDLKQFGKKMGRDFKNEDVQIAFLAHELQNTSEKSSLDAIKKAKTVEEATAIWTRKFERPSEREIRASIDRRIKNARAFEKQFS